jgi:hypothetical protein
MIAQGRNCFGKCVIGTGFGANKNECWLILIRLEINLFEAISEFNYCIHSFSDANSNNISCWSTPIRCELGHMAAAQPLNPSGLSKGGTACFNAHSF